MLKQLLAATSVAALLAGAGLANAQDAGGATAPSATPPGATPAPMPPDPAAPAPVAPAMPAPAAQMTPPVEAPAAPADTAAAPATPATEATTPAPAAGPVMPPSAPDVATAPPAGTGPASVSTDDMMGRAVRGSDGEPLGRVSDVVIDSATGKIQRLVIASGGFLGIGAKNVALEFDKVEIRPEGGIVATGVTQADVEKLPTYDVAAETKTLSAPPPAPVAPAGGPAIGLTPESGAGGGGAAEPSTANPNLGVTPRAQQPAQ